MLYTGMDVSADKISVAVKNNSKLFKFKEFNNNASGHKQIIKYISSKKCKTRVCLEATGVYHFDLAVAISNIQHFEIMVINPRQAKHYATVINAKLKTDKADAEILSDFALRMKFVPWQRPSENRLRLRYYARRIEALVHQKAQSKNQLHALEFSEYTPKEVIKSVQAMIAIYEQEIDRMQKIALEQINQQEDLREYFQLMISISGVGERSAILLLGELLVLPDDLTNKQLVAFAGLNPKIVSSGKSVLKQTKISKSGNKQLRMALYMPALTAVNCDPFMKAYYWHLIEDNGLKKLQALCAVMRKLLHAMNQMLKKKEIFCPARFYRLPVVANQLIAS